MKVKFFIVLIVWLIFGCSVRNQRTLPISDSPYTVFLLGYIEDRYTDFDPYIIDNFIDMLIFELNNYEIEVKQVPKEFIVEELKKVEKKVENTNDEIKTLLPDFTTDFYKYSNENKRVQRLNFRLNRNQLLELKEKVGYDYVLRGTVSQLDVGKFLEEKVNVVIFLELLNEYGVSVGKVNYYVEGETLADASELHTVCADISLEVNRVLLKREKLKGNSVTK